MPLHGNTFSKKGNRFPSKGSYLFSFCPFTTECQILSLNSLCSSSWAKGLCRDILRNLRTCNVKFKFATMNHNLSGRQNRSNTSLSQNICILKYYKYNSLWYNLIVFQYFPLCLMMFVSYTEQKLQHDSFPSWRLVDIDHVPILLALKVKLCFI